MEPTDVSKPIASAQGSKGCQLYSAPGFRRLSPEAAKDLLLQRADVRDPKVQQMLERIEELKEKKGP
jgi:hypothetical protein